MNEKLQEAITLYKKGNKAQALKLLAEIVRQEPNNSVAWYGLALCLDERDKKIYFLKKVLSLDPIHKKARQLLEKLQGIEKTPNFQKTINATPALPTERSYSSPWLMLSIVGIIGVISICAVAGIIFANSMNIFQPSPTPIPTRIPTLTPKEEIKRSAYLACAKYSYEPYYYPFAYASVSVENWSPITYPLPKSAVTDLGDNQYKVDLYVKYTLAHVEQSPVSGKDVVIRNDYQDIWECNAHYRGTEDGIEYWDIDILGRKN